MSEGLLRPCSAFQRNRYRSVSACVITPSSREAACSAYPSHEPSEVAPPGTTFVLNGRGSDALKAGNSPTGIIGHASSFSSAQCSPKGFRCPLVAAECYKGT